MPVEDGDFKWFRVIGVTCGAVCKDPDAAWKSFYRRAPECSGGRIWNRGTAEAANRARLIEATTMRAAQDADISEDGGCIGRGEWRYARE